MIRSCVTIALVKEIKTGPWIFWEDLEQSMAKASAMGFDAIELFTSSAAAVDPNVLKPLLEKYKLKLAAVGTGAGKVLHGLTLTDPSEAVRKQAISFISDMIAFGAAFGAPAIIGSMQGQQGQDRQQALAWLAEGLRMLSHQADEKGVALIYEPLNRYETTLFNTLEAGVNFIESEDLRNVKLLADLFHMNIEESDMPASIRAHANQIGHVHFADSNRRPMGNGHAEMGPIAIALQESGYSGYVSAEAFPWPDSDAAALQTIRAFRQYFQNS